MSTGLVHAWDARIERLLAKLPNAMRRSVHWLRRPHRRWARFGAAGFFMLGGVLAVLPVFGLWMLPLGLALLAEDLPGMKPWLEGAAQRIEGAWHRIRGRPAR
jgi:hypothetical protein